MVSQSGAILVAESWRHRLLSYRIRQRGTGGRAAPICRPIRPDSAGRQRARRLAGLFAPRSQLVEFVLREPAFRKRMMAEVAPDHLGRPDAERRKSFSSRCRAAA